MLLLMVGAGGGATVCDALVKGFAAKQSKARARARTHARTTRERTRTHARTHARARTGGFVDRK